MLYDRVLPTELRVEDGTGQAIVRLKGTDERFLPEVASEMTDAQGRLPARIAGQLAPEFTDVPTRHGTATLWSVEAAAPLTIYGVVKLEGGIPVLEDPDTTQHYVVSPYTAARIDQIGRSESIAMIVWGWIALAGAPATAIWMRLRRKRKGDRRSTDPKDQWRYGRTR